jgi:secreted PhoX family phosphatase
MKPSKSKPSVSNQNVRTRTAVNRRDFIRFLGYSTAALPLGGLGLASASLISGCTTTGTNPSLNAAAKGQPLNSAKLPFQPLGAVSEDQLSLIDGMDFRVLVKWNDVINSRGAKFGINNDFNAFIPNEGPDEGFLCVNHEYPSPVLQYAIAPEAYRNRSDIEKTKEQIRIEQQSVGVSILKVRQRRDLSEADGGHWYVVQNSSHNRRIDALTPIPFANNVKIGGSKTAIGTLSNCAGGVTPWGTYLSCEENYDQFWGEVDYEKGNGRIYPNEAWGWWKKVEANPEHYGWVVEINPKTGAAKKLTALGRFAHESATVVPLPDGRCVVYSGDDTADRCLYKFIADRPGSLETGRLYVANLDTGTWVPLIWEDSALLKKHFSSQLEVLIRAREASLLVGGTKLDRPEDVERDPNTGAIIVALTNNKKKGNIYGSLLKIVEENNSPASLRFTHSTLLLGGPTTGVSCPDNMAFDPAGNLWLTTDMGGRDMNKGHYEGFGNNALFVVPKAGPLAGSALKVVSAPTDAELTGPWFAPDGKTLFLSVQHPGEESRPGQYTSHWPLGGDSLPHSAVVTIRGPMLEEITSGRAFASKS